MQETFGDQKLITLFSGKLHPDPLAKTGRPLAHINGHIPDHTLNDAHQFGLRSRGRLKMQAAYGADILTVGLVILRKLKTDAMSCQCISVIGFAEMATRVGKPQGRDLNDTCKGGFFNHRWRHLTL